MNTYAIYKISGLSDTFCCKVQAENERSALVKYKNGMTSTSQKWIERVLGSVSLYTSCGEQFVAVKTI